MFEKEYPSTSKIFVEWNDTINGGDLSEEQINQIFNSSKIKIKVLTTDVADANSRIYQEISENSGFNYFDVTRKVKFLTGYTIEIANFSDKEKASDLIKSLESEKFQNIFLEEIINSNSSNYRVYVGNYETTGKTKDDYVKLMNVVKDSKLRIVKIGK
ncbi:MAG: SPOR domain-containing protein [Bacteroidota bacterium]|nr:SPOR domain-containing protein [Bacteroidota bacterium]